MEDHPARRVAALIACVLVAPACQRDPPFPAYDGPDFCVRFRTSIIPQNLKTGVDLLFVIENTPQMAELQPSVSERMRSVLKPIQDLADKGTYADVHIGVVTTDMGAGATGSAQCEPANAHPRGLLQSIGAAAKPGCRGPVDANWIQYDYNPEDPDQHNLPAGQSLADTLECMTAVGEGGCEYPQPLEAAYTALRSPANYGFLRDEAVLLIAFITAQEDCSAPADTDLFDPRKTGEYGPPGNYRCSRFGVGCPGPLPANGRTIGPVRDCAPLPNPWNADRSRLYDIHRYTDAFDLPRIAGGIKDSPLDVVILSVSGPTQPYAPIALAPGSTPQQPLYCDALSTCVPAITPTCNAGDFHALPSVRLDAVTTHVKQFERTSVCTDDWSPILAPGFNLSVCSCLGFGCMRDAFPDPKNPQCSVTDVTLNADGSETRTRLTRCDMDGKLPCWEIIERIECAAPVSPQNLGFQVRREFHGAPPHTSTLVECAVLCGP